MVQVPADTSVRVVPVAVQTAVVTDEKLTGRLELDVAESGRGATPNVWAAGALNVIVWVSKVAGFTVKLRETIGAGA